MNQGDSPGLVGRDAELLQIDSFLDAISVGSRALLVTGDLGIGRTSLLQFGLERALSRGIRVLSSRPSEAEARLSFSALADLVGPSLAEGLPELPLVQRDALEAAVFMGETEGSAPNELGVCLAALGMLRTLAGSGRILIGLDDVQWLDPASGRVLEYSLRRLDRELVGVMATARVDDPTDPPFRLDRVLVDERLKRLDIGPLSPRAMGAMLRERLLLQLSRSEISELHRLSGGNPFFALEIARTLDRERANVGIALEFRIPAGLQELAHERLSALRPDVRETVLAAALLSEPTVELLASALSSKESVERALAAAADAGVVELPGDTVRFSNPLLGTVLTSEATDEQRRSVHRRLASVVSEPEERARHLALASDGPDPDVAQALEDAGRTVRRRGAPLVAAELTEMSQQLTPSEDTDDLARRTIASAEYHFEAGDTVRAASLLEALLQDLPPGPVRGTALQRLGWIRYHEQGWSMAERLFEEAADAARPDAAVSAALDLDRSTAALLSGDLPRAGTLAGAVLVRAEEQGDRGLAADALAVAGAIEFLTGQGLPDELMKRALEMESWTRPRPTIAHPSVAYGLLLKWSDDLDGARKRLDAACKRTRDQGSERSLPFLLFHLAELECWAGNWDAAERLATEGDDVAVATAQESSRAFTLYARALVDVLRGRVEAARETGAEGLGIAERSGASPVMILHLSALGSLELALGDTASAARYFGPLAEGTIRSGIQEPGVLRYLGDALETLLGVGDVDRAAELLELVDESATRLQRVWALAVASRCRGLLESASGDQPGALGYMEESLEHHARLGQPFELGRTLLAKGIVQRRDRQKAAARATLEQALATFQELGAPLWVERTAAELGRIGGRAPSSLELTPTERRVADLAAGGATNQEIASAQFMSVKTVEWNLTRIYRKAGVRSRTELARWLAAKGP